VAAKKSAPFYLQDFLWEESIQAVKDSPGFSSLEEFVRHLEASLPQNSECTRQRYAQNVIRWFFPESSLDGLLTQAWCYYEDENLLKELMRHQFLCVQPVVAQFVTEYILPAEPGTTLYSSILDEFVRCKYGVLDRKVKQRLGNTIEQLGFAQRNKGNRTIVQLPAARTAFFLLTHFLFAPTPSLVSLKEILENPFWKYLGFRYADGMRKILKEAAANDLLAKYVIADELEQITTKYSFKEILEHRFYL